MSSRKILFITKFPPWQGGTANHALTAALAFLREGYETHILTLEPDAALGLTYTLDDSANKWLDRLSITRLAVNNHRVSTLVGDATFSLLLGEAMAIIKSNKIDVVIGWYFEPFGIAAAIASKILQVPCFLRHAGSDLDRLTENPSICNAYKAAFSECELIFTNTNNVGVMTRIERLRLPASKVLNLTGAKLPEYFTKYRHKNEIEFDEAVRPIKFLIYGKISSYKGVEELASVVGIINSMGLDSRLINVAVGSPEAFRQQKNKISEILNGDGKFEMIESVSPWKIPEVMEACDFVCVLENCFPIEIHSGIILREALSSGKVVIVSKDVVDSSAFRSSLCDGLNCIIIDDVSDIGSFAKKVYTIAKNHARRRSIGYLSLKLSHFIESQLPERHPMIEAIGQRLGWVISD